jgi:type IV secretion system protein VirD4
MSALRLLPLLGVVALLWALARPDPLLGWLGGGRVSSHGESRWATAREAGRLGRRSAPGRLLPDGLVLGWFGRRVLQTPAEDNLLCFGVQRSGKTSTIAVPTLLGWRGAVVATSIKTELLALTSGVRRQVAPVYVYAPLEPAPAADDLVSVRWNPLADVTTAFEAVELADLFTAEGTHGEAAHWYRSASSLLAGWFLLLRRQGDLRGVLEKLNRTRFPEYVSVAARAGDPVAEELLTAFAQTPDREAGSIASTARSCLSLWLDDRVARATSADGDQLSVDGLLEEGATLYLVAPPEEAIRLRPLFSALIQSILRRATARARRGGGVLRPRLLLALDEVANFARIPRLATHVCTGPGQGINWLLCFHDLAQLEEGYGPEQARTVWNNCRAHLLLPGQSDLKTLEQFSRAIGDETRTYRVESTGGGRWSSSEQRIGRPLASVDHLRRLTDPVLVYANAPPARLRARRWDQVPAWRALVESRRV